MVPIYLPPLRERREDIPALARSFLERHSEENRRDPPELTPDVLDMLLEHDWPGNVRELENYMARAVVLANGGPLTPDLLAPPGRGRSAVAAAQGQDGGDLHGLIQQLVRLGIQTLAGRQLYERIVGGVERELIEQVLEQCGRTQVKAALRWASTAIRCIRKWTTTARATRPATASGRDDGDWEKTADPPSVL